MTNKVKWLENAIFYEIYPQTFRDTNADGIGDINGITEKLGYIKDLGCTAIWLNPCFDSPFGDAGYDVRDYYRVAPRYGTNEDLIRLFDKVHENGMHIILDLVPGHTSWEHEWFRKSMRAEKNEFSDRYIWTDSIWESPDCLPSLRGISDRDASCAVNFFSHQPALNYGFYKPSLPWHQGMEDEGPRATLEAVKDIMRFWLKAGCDGFRVDMAGSLVKNDEEGKGNIALWRKIRAFLDEEFPEAAMVSEWGEPDKSLLGGFHMDFLLHFGPSRYNDLFRCDEPYFSRRGKGDIKAFVEKYLDSYNKTDKKGLICIPSGNHDMDRLARRLSGDELKAAFAFILSMPGAPFIYYGDEIGMNYVEGLVSVEGGYGRTGSRSPMQWDKTLINDGFSAASPDRLYIPLDPRADRPDASSQCAGENSLRSEIKRLIALRKANKALWCEAELEFINVGYPLVYKKTCPEQSITVIINPADRPAAIEDISGRIIHTACGSAELNGGKCTVSGCTAVFVENDR